MFVPNSERNAVRRRALAPLQCLYAGRLVTGGRALGSRCMLGVTTGLALVGRTG